MSIGVAKLPDFEAEQNALAEMEVGRKKCDAAGTKWLASSSDEDLGDQRDFGVAFSAAGPGQLALENDQQILGELEPEPRQLVLLPDPAPWEADREPIRVQGPSGRLLRRRTMLGISPGQTSLF